MSDIKDQSAAQADDYTLTIFLYDGTVPGTEGFIEDINRQILIHMSLDINFSGYDLVQWVDNIRRTRLRFDNAPIGHIIVLTHGEPGMFNIGQEDDPETDVGAGITATEFASMIYLELATDALITLLCCETAATANGQALLRNITDRCQATVIAADAVVNAGIRPNGQGVAATTAGGIWRSRYLPSIGRTIVTRFMDPTAPGAQENIFPGLHSEL